MIIRCAWCNKITGEKPPYGASYDKMITDGICRDCEKKWFGLDKYRFNANDQEPTLEQIRQFELDEIEIAKEQYMAEMDMEKEWLEQ